ncbi:SPW repeat protein [Amycolatopsis sp. OK19-0408]|uniref:SPW repeat protein n=1 Tax=Amycolatopsis iheyensis TaxID=2945988 RepID=A0A9X2SRK1_9PSEU|nr:SPW repeat protein [Amycolatopsis iheyensis]MCR6490646.1 SPW repeat protein [Amycolatopsis iheyensis]
MSTGTDERRALRDRRPGQALQGSLVFATVNALTFLAGTWLALSPFVLDQTRTGDGFNGYWNDVLAGAALVVLGALSLIDVSVGRAGNVARLLIGAWLVMAPFALGYNVGTPAPETTVSDLVTGLVMLALRPAGALCLAARVRR